MKLLEEIPVIPDFGTSAQMSDNTLREFAVGFLWEFLVPRAPAGFTENPREKFLLVKFVLSEIQTRIPCGTPRRIPRSS